MHRTCTINEISARYATLPAEWYVPELDNIGIKSANNKQGRDMVPFEEMDKASQLKIQEFTHILDDHNHYGYLSYQNALASGIAPELARSFLQVNHYTHWVWKQDLRNMLGFLKLRLDSHAQYEARVYAQAIFDLLSRYLPESMKFLEKEEQRKAPESFSLLSYVRRFFVEGV